ncbi:unnamed protein product [Caenorhabditis auriculariae]|uniref:Uncharacterized protein n=1 Tax=Caenorhabditis auriculariae TaxID=2777116 RepID=A0A8S1H3Y1_9PELO|nr:unnamed protein product [Caenorhabditis auriculariae]
MSCPSSRGLCCRIGALVGGGCREKDACISRLFLVRKSAQKVESCTLASPRLPCSLAGSSQAYMRPFLCQERVLWGEAIFSFRARQFDGGVLLLGCREKRASPNRTFSEPIATYQRLDLRLQCTLEPEVEASDSGSTASLWGLKQRSLARALKAWAGDSASGFIDSRGGWGVRVRRPLPATVTARENSGSGPDPAGQNQVQKGEENTLFNFTVQSVRFDAALGVRRRPASIPSHRST